MKKYADVLSVEDDPRIALLIRTTLESEGYRVRLCQDGVEALRSIEEEEPDVVLLDLMLPRMDGREFVWELRRRGKSTPVVVVSAAPDLRQRVADLPVQDFIAKPFDIRHLLSAVDSIVSAN